MNARHNMVLIKKKKVLSYSENLCLGNKIHNYAYGDVPLLV